MSNKSKEEKQAYNKEYYEKNKEKALEKAKSLYEKKKKELTPDQKLKHAEHQREYYQENKEAILKRNKSSQRKHYKKNRDSILKKSKEYRLTQLGTPEYRFRRAIQTAKQRKILFSLTYEQYLSIVNLPCYYCDYQFCSPVIEDSGLDRIDSNKGYEIDNVISCGGRCNLIKNHDLTMEEAKAAIQTIISIRLQNKNP
jgi:hypothetical protein